MNSLTLTLTDHDILADLERYGDTGEQRRIALVALRLGLQALRHARGEIDALALQQTAERVLEQVEARFNQHLNDHADLLGRTVLARHPRLPLAARRTNP